MVNPIKRLLGPSIRRNLQLLVLAAFLPGVVILLYTFHALQENVVREVEDYTLRQVQAIAAHHEQVLDDAQLLLLTLSKTCEFRGLNVPACQALLQEILPLNPAFVGLGLANDQGTLVASSPPGLPRGLAGESYFRNALQTGEFTIGQYLLRDDKSGVIIHFAQPVLDDAGRTIGVLVAIFDMNYLVRIFQNAHLPKNSVLTMTDSAGVRLTRFPETEKYTWVPDLPRMIQRMSGASEEGAFQETGVDGVRRLYGFKRQGLKGSSLLYLSFRLGIPVEHALAKPRTVLYHNLVLLGLAAFLSMTLAWLLGESTILRRLQKLVGSAEVLGGGNLAARTGLAHSGDELGRLAGAFDGMAESLERRDMDTQKAQAEIQRLLQEKLDCLDQLARCVAHELRNPVTTIGGLTRRLLRQVDETTTTGDYLKKILADTERLEEIVKEVREYADLPAPSPEREDLGALTGDIAEAYRESARQAGVEIILQGAMGQAGQVEAWVDRTLLEKAYRVLMQNALEAMPGGGVLSLGLTSDGQAATVTVSDTGRGIARQDMPFLFHPFFTTKANAVGISLSTVKRIVTEHQWDLKVTSQEGRGTTFTLTIPLGPPLALSQPRRPEPGGDGVGGRLA